ncbi:MAG TPA: hypothetical protein VJK54_00620 [Chthoniobacterales bacterium]|nr:hypothetical protein [Chthoniobacterales bacterium]
MKIKIILLLLFITLESLNLLFAYNEQASPSLFYQIAENDTEDCNNGVLSKLAYADEVQEILDLEKPQLQMDPKIVEGIQEGIEGLITQEKTKTSSVKISPRSNLLRMPERIETTSTPTLISAKTIIRDLQDRIDQKREEICEMTAALREARDHWDMLKNTDTSRAGMKAEEVKAASIQEHYLIALEKANQELEALEKQLKQMQRNQETTRLIHFATVQDLWDSFNEAAEAFLQTPNPDHSRDLAAKAEEIARISEEIKTKLPSSTSIIEDTIKNSYFQKIAEETAITFHQVSLAVTKAIPHEITEAAQTAAQAAEHIAALTNELVGTSLEAEARWATETTQKIAALTRKVHDSQRRPGSSQVLRSIFHEKNTSLTLLPDIQGSKAILPPLTRPNTASCGMVQEKTLLQIEDDRKLIETGKAIETAIKEKGQGTVQQLTEHIPQTTEPRILQNQEELDFLAKAAQARTAGHYEEADLWTKAAEASAAEAKISEKNGIATLWGRAAEATIKVREGRDGIADLWAQAAKAKSSENEIDYERFDSAGWSVSFSAHAFREASAALQNAAQAKEANQETEAANQLGRAQLCEERAEYHAQAAKARSTENKTDFQYFSEAAKKAVEYYMQAAKAKSNGNETDYERFDSAGWSASSSAHALKEASEALKKAVQAKEANQETETAHWHKTAQQYEQAANYYDQAVKAKLSENETDYERFESAGYSANASAHALKEASETLKKAAQAKEANQREEADRWHKIAQQYEQAANYYDQAAKAQSSGNEIDYERFKSAGSSANSSANALKEASEALKKAAQAKKVNQREEADRWQKIAQQYEKAAEYLTQAVKAQLSGNETDYERFESAGSSANSSAHALKEASTALKKATQAKEANQREEVALKKAAQAKEANQETEVALWIKIAQRKEEEAEYKAQAAKAKFNEDKTNYDRFFNAGKYANFSADTLEEASEALKKAAQAKEANQREEAALQLKITKQKEESAEYYVQAAKAKFNEDETNYNRFDSAGYSANSSANALKEASEALKKAAQATKANQREEVALQLKIARQYEESAEYYAQAVKAKFNEDETDYDRFSNAGNFSNSSANALEEASEALKKAVQAKAANQEEEAALWQKIAQRKEEQAEYLAQMAKAQSSGNETDYYRFIEADTSASQSANALEEASEALKKAVQAKAANQEEEAALWQKIAQQKEEEADKYYADIAKVLEETIGELDDEEEDKSGEF